MSLVFGTFLQFEMLEVEGTCLPHCGRKREKMDKWKED